MQVAPAVKGTFLFGATVSASTGTWTGADTDDLQVPWQRCGLRGSCIVIAGATSASYTLTSWDVGRRLKVTVTASNLKGSASATSALSALVSRGSTSTPASERDRWDAGWAGRRWPSHTRRSRIAKPLSTAVSRPSPALVTAIWCAGT